MAKAGTVIAVHVDLSKTFVDPDGSFYCGTTERQRQNAATIAGIADWNLFCTDLHPMTSSEFAINGGLYPIHSVPRPDELDMASYGLQGKTASSRMSAEIENAVDTSLSGIHIARQVYFQEIDDSISFKPEDVEATFGLPLISDEEFLANDFSYVVMPKFFFDATRLTVESDPGAGVDYPGIPKKNINVFSLIKRKYSQDRKLVFIVPSVVENICTHHTASGIRQEFPTARVIIPSDATTPLAGVKLGFEQPSEVAAACAGLARDIGIEYLETERISEEFGI